MVRSQVAGRYYYNLRRRIRKGRSASNFSANYAALGLAFPLTDSPARTSPEPEGASIQLTGLLRIGLALGR